MDTIKKIAELEDSIEVDADLEAKLDRYVRREKKGDHRELVEHELRHLRQRLDYKQAELRELYALRRYEVARGTRIVALNAMKPPVRFFGIDEVPA